MPTWRTASPTSRLPPPRRSGWPPRRGSPAARSRIIRAIANTPIYDFDLSVERVRAAVALARSLPVPFVLTARAENLIRGRNDMADTIRRLKAYSAAGAEVLYAPGLRTAAEIRAVVEAIDRPLNVVTGWLEPGITVADVAAAGAKRISVGGALNRLALAAFVDAARAMKEEGSFAWMQRIADMGPLRKMFAAAD